VEAVAVAVVAQDAAAAVADALVDSWWNKRWLDARKRRDILYLLSKGGDGNVSVSHQRQLLQRCLVLEAVADPGEDGDVAAQHRAAEEALGHGKSSP